MKITDRSLSIKPTKQQWLYDDSQVKGHGTLAALVNPTGKISFHFRYTHEGKRYRYPLGGYDRSGIAGLTLKEARIKAGELSRLHQSGITDIKGHFDQLTQQEAAQAEADRIAALQLANRLTVKQLFTKWHEGYLQQARKDEGASILAQFNNDVLPAIGSMYADQVKRGHILEITDAILKRGCNRLAKLTLSNLRAMFHWAVVREWLDADPTAAIAKRSIGKRDIPRDRLLKEDEIALLFQKLPDAGLRPTTQAAVLICLSTLCRIGELRQAKWSDIDLDNRTWRIPAENSKNGYPHEIYLSDFALEQFQIIKQHSKSDTWLYPNREDTGPIDRRAISNQILDRQKPTNKTNRAANTEALLLPGGRWTLHDLRRTGTTLLQRLKVSYEVREACLNHIGKDVLQATYSKYEYETEMKQAWRRLGLHLSNIRQNKTKTKVVPIKSAANV